MPIPPPAPSPPPSPGVIIIPIGHIKELKSFPSKTTPPSQAVGSNDLLLKVLCKTDERYNKKQK